MANNNDPLQDKRYKGGPFDMYNSDNIGHITLEDYKSAKRILGPPKYSKKRIPIINDVDDGAIDRNEKFEAMLKAADEEYHRLGREHNERKRTAAEAMIDMSGKGIEFYKPYKAINRTKFFY
jgi:hypothetical protein